MTLLGINGVVAVEPAGVAVVGEAPIISVRCPDGRRHAAMRWSADAKSGCAWKDLMIDVSDVEETVVAAPVVGICGWKCATKVDERSMIGLDVKKTLSSSSLSSLNVRFGALGLAMMDCVSSA